MSKKILKFGTGECVPEGAVYLSTITQAIIMPVGVIQPVGNPVPQLVWHYFLVEDKEV